MEKDNLKEFIDGMEEQELLQCLQAAKLADGEAPVEVSRERAAAFVDKTVRASGTRRIIRISFISTLAAAACFAVAVFVGRNPRGGEIQPYVAAVDTVETQGDLREPAPETLIPEMGKEEVRIASTMGKRLEKAVSQHDMAPVEVHEAETFVRSAQATVKALKMVRPNKELYKVRVVNESKLFSFVWEADSVASCVVTLSDSLGNTIVERHVTGENYFDFAAADALKYREIHWRVLAVFADQSRGENKGIVIFDKAQ